jgi:hypothetical protein
MRDKDEIISGLENLERDLKAYRENDKSLLREAVAMLRGESDDHMRCTICGLIVDLSFKAEFPKK